MKEMDVLKELLKFNFSKLADKINIDNFVVGFKGYKFYVINGDNEVVMEDEIVEQDLFTRMDQQKIILKVAKSVFPVAMNLKELDLSEKYYLEKKLEIDDKNYIDILGEGNIYSPENIIEVDLKKIFLANANDNINEENYPSFMNWVIRIIVNDIERKIKKNNIRIVLYFDMENYYFKIYVDGVMREVDFCMGFIEFPYITLHKANRLKRLTVENVKSVFDYDVFKLYYKTASKKEIEEATKIVEDIVKDNIELLEERLNKYQVISVFD